MEELIFSKLQKGDTLFTLERDRRSMYPIFDKATVVRVGETKPMASGNDGNYVSSIGVVIQDSVSSLTIFLPVQTTEGIHNGVYYTTDLKNIVNESLLLQIAQELGLNKQQSAQASNGKKG